MKNLTSLIGIVLALTVCCPLLAQETNATAKPAAVSGPLTAQPSDSNSTTPFNQMCQNRVDGVQGKTFDLLFIGDTYVQLWLREGGDVWKKNYASRGAFNFGSATDATQNILWRMSTMSIGSFDPKVVIIQAGNSNFLSAPKPTPDDVAAGVKAIADQAHTLFPSAKILLVSVVPTRFVADVYQPINALISKLADGKTIYYVDITKNMTPDGSGGFNDIGADHFSPTPQFYTDWAAAMDPTLNSILAK